jgi:hypothetical protein
MNIQQIRKLCPGDQIYWNDPDDGRCSRIYEIKNIRIDDDEEIVTIEEPDGSLLMCYISEID